MLSKFRLTSQKGFTLIELLIVVAIIGILAAIAIPQFGAYRKRGYNAAANSDLRSIRTTEEAMMADFAEYGASRLASDAAASAAQEATATVFLVGAMTSTTNQSISLSPRVYAAVKAGQVAGTPNARYNAVTSHSQGDQYYGADSDGTSLYRQGFATWAAGATLTATPAAATGVAEFASPWVTMQ